MPARLALLACLTVAVLPLGAQGPTYSPGTTRYRISTSSTASQTTPLGSQDFQLNIQQQYTVSIARQAADTLLETLSVDSVSVNATTATPDLSALRGSTYTARVSPTGRVYSADKLDTKDQLAAQLGDAVARFLPVYRPGLAVGMSWSDTTKGRAMQQGVEVDRTIVADYRVVGDTTLDGQKALEVDRVTRTTAAGNGVAAGAAVSLQADTRSDARFYISPAGVYLGGHSNDDVNLRLTLLGQGAEITVKQVARTKIEAIP